MNIGKLTLTEDKSSGFEPFSSRLTNFHVAFFARRFKISGLCGGVLVLIIRLGVVFQLV